MDWEPEQLDLGALGFAGICRETYRVLLRAILRHNNKVGRGAAILSALLLAHIAANRALLSLLSILDDAHDLVLGVAAFAYILCIFVLFLLSLICTAAFVFRVTSLYCTHGDSGACDRILRDLPRAPRDLPHAPRARLVRMLRHVIPLAMSYPLISIAACLVLLLLDTSNEVVILPLRVIGGAACLVGAAHASAVLHIACVVTVLEDPDPFGAMRKSCALLAGKFWAVAAVFVPLDGCYLALQISSLLLTLEDSLGLGRGFQVAAGAAMAVALCAVVVVTQVAQAVVYLVCKNHHHHEVVEVQP